MFVCILPSMYFANSNLEFYSYKSGRYYNRTATQRDWNREERKEEREEKKKSIAKKEREKAGSEGKRYRYRCDACWVGYRWRGEGKGETKPKGKCEDTMRRKLSSQVKWRWSKAGGKGKGERGWWDEGVGRGRCTGSGGAVWPAICSPVRPSTIPGDCLV